MLTADSVTRHEVLDETPDGQGKYAIGEAQIVYPRTAASPPVFSIEPRRALVADGACEPTRLDSGMPQASFRVLQQSRRHSRAPRFGSDE